MGLKTILGALVSKAGKLCINCCQRSPVPGFCYYKYQVVYDCDTETWGSITLVSTLCLETDPVALMDAWVGEGSDGSTYVYSYWTKGFSCITTGDCLGPMYPPVDPPADPPCPAESSPCRCTDPTTAYTITGYNGAYFDPCVDCEDSEWDPWDGTFHMSAACEWRAADGNWSINGKGMGFVSIRLINQGTAGPCYWELQIACNDIEHPGQLLIWKGRKFVGATAAGTYNRVAGCDTRATVVLA